MVDKQIFIVVLLVLAVALIFDAFPTKESFGISGQPVRSAQSSQSTPLLTPLPMVAYYSDGSGELWIAKCTDIDCTFPLHVPIATMPVDHSGYKPVQLMKGSDDLPIIAVRTREGNPPILSMKIVHCGNRLCNSGNQITTVATGDSISTFSIDAGSDGMPLIAYIEEASMSSQVASVHLIHCKDVACTSSDNTIILSVPVGQGAQPSYGVALAGGETGKPYIAFGETYNYFYNDLYLGRCTDLLCSSFTTTLLESYPNYDVFADVNMILGSDGLPLISYYKFIDSTAAQHLRILHCRNTECTQKSVTTIAQIPQNPTDPNSMMTGSNGLPWIFYYSYDSPFTGFMKLVKCLDNACGQFTTPQVVDSVGPNSFPPYPRQNTIAYNANGNPVMSYFDSNDIKNAIKIAMCRDPQCNDFNIVNMAAGPPLALAGGLSSLALI